MSDIRDKPLRVWAKLDGKGDACWWLRLVNGDYACWPWPAEGRQAIVESHRLVPTRVDFSHDCGDSAAIIECHNARDRHAARSGS